MCKLLVHVCRTLWCTYAIVWAMLPIVLRMLTPLISMAQPTPTPTLAPGEFVANKVVDIVGIWQTRFCIHDVAYIQYNADGTSTLAATLEALENNSGLHGTFWFEGTILHVKDPYGQGTYEIRVKTEGDQRVHLAFRVINDSVRTRVRDLTEGMPRFDPALKIPYAGLD